MPPVGAQAVPERAGGKTPSQLLVIEIEAGMRHETRVISTHGANLLLELLKFTVEQKPKSIHALKRLRKTRRLFICQSRTLVNILPKSLSEKLLPCCHAVFLGPTTALAMDGKMMEHKPVRGSHVECPQRLLSIWNQLVRSGLAAQCCHIQSRKATRAEITACHTDEHFDKITNLVVTKGVPTEIDGDTYFNQATSECALLAAGTLIECVYSVARGQNRNGFALLRPPGHHAYADAAGGFCLFNNVAIATRAALAEPNINKVLIVDWDVHHGNGTESIFYGSKEVLFFSVHGHDEGSFFPGTGDFLRCGENGAEGYNVNVPWPCFGFGDQEYLAVFKEVLLPIATQFNPDLIMVSAGFDAAIHDPLGNMCVTPGGFAAMLKLLLPLAGGKVVLALEGGYNLKSIAECSEACLAALLGQEAPAPSETWRKREEAERAIKQTKEVQSYFWTL
eukprot:TRINITY_DN97092_c0_g1_i1.p1 TRINITY_DN97092_c0_g1~~TRINITY_DN97092_c0_g1_i1.p1  ORF type:complete len:450 (+),score=50.19 TRINITY_DN97092_c0_g1_i1:569-1918(+)